MAFDEGLAERIRDVFRDRGDVVEQRMFGGLAFLVGGRMTVGIVGDDLMARVGPGAYEEALRRPHARKMDFTGKPMRGFVYVGAEGIAEDEDLEAWIRLAMAYAGSGAAKKK